MELYVLFWIVLLAATGFFATYQFGLTWPYSSEAGGHVHQLNILTAISGGIAFFFKILVLFIVISHQLEWIGDWLTQHQTLFSWCVWFSVLISGIFGLWAFFGERMKNRTNFRNLWKSLPIISNW